MVTTRVDTAVLAGNVAKADTLFDQLVKLLYPQLVVLADDAREALPRPPVRYAKVAGALIDAAMARPALCTAAEFDPAAVKEDLANVQELLVFTAKVQELLQRLVDSRLQWLAEAYVPSLHLYKMAKVRAESDGELRLIIEPMEEVFAPQRRPRGKKKKKGAPTPTP